jgi:hypothetical protein
MWSWLLHYFPREPNPAPLSEITQQAIDRGAAACYPHAAVSTVIRQYYVPVARVMHCAALVDVAKPLGIAVHDHIIVGRDGHASLKGLRLI